MRERLSFAPTVLLYLADNTKIRGQGDGSLGSPILGAKTTTYTYTALGKVESVVDSLNNRQEFTYDSMGRNTVVRDALNNMSTAEYDKLGNVTKLVGPLGDATNYSYDQMGRLISESTLSGGTITYGYNALNIKEQLTNARGQVRKFFYDAMGRITGFVGAEDSVSYAYDDNGNVLTVSDKNGVIKREYDALNRIIKLTDTFGKSIQYTYDAVGNLASIIYPDNTAVNYTYDANNNLVSVTDWANRVTSYTYDVNNMVVGVTKPDGSVTTTVYDNAQRIVSTVERTASNVVITGYEYTYDNLSRIIEEKHLADNTKICYTYDNLSRVTNRTIKNECDCVISSENFTYDAAGNITDAPNSCFEYDTNNRLIVFNGNTVSYDMDGNMLSNGYINCEFDSGNRLISAGSHTYTYNAEDVRIRNLCSDADTTYTYNTNCRLSQLLCKTTNGITTKYVYGLGLIGEETSGSFKTYHFDYRGSTAAITDINGNVTDTFEYDTYGNLVSRTGTSVVIFLYNGRDGVVTDSNGLIYMRARYYSPELRRFINADIIAGEISNAATLNRYAYANGNPVSNTDPFGLSAERGTTTYDEKYYKSKAYKKIQDNADDILLYSWYFGVDPNIVAGVIFKEQYSNYDWIDVCTDWVAFYGVIDMSVGLGQVRVSTAKFLEEQGYVPETSAEEGGWNIPFIGFVHGTETMAREKRLEDNSWNIMYVAAYIKYFEDTWIDVFPEISSRPDILGTLYNIGHEKTSPNSNPGSNKFGDDVEYFYDLMGEALK